MHNSINRFLNKFQRVTSSGNFIPEIDGLRFIAIASVTLFHVNNYIVEKSNWIINPQDKLYKYWNHVLNHGYLGVELFFVISGFILAFPFARHYKKGTQLPTLKSYFIRRLTRLEPPYFLIMIILFAAHIFIIKKYPINELILSLVASLTYTHNFFYGIETPPLINVVTWSLEIEIQFYILAPVIANIYRIKSTEVRRGIMIVIMLGFIICQQLYRPDVYSLYYFGQFFLLGFLLVDQFLEGTRIFRANLLSAIIGVIFFTFIWAINYKAGETILTKIALGMLLPFAIYVFYYLAFFSVFWKKVLSIKLLTVIGGMCYSLYLTHYAIISMFGRLFIRYKFSNVYYFDWGIKTIILLLPVLIVGALVFKFIEQPCMKHGWYYKFLPFRAEKEARLTDSNTKIKAKDVAFNES